MRKLWMLTAACPLLFAGPALAGFIAQTGTPAYTYTGPGTPGSPLTGGMITVSEAPLQSYSPDTAFDPQINGADLNRYLLSLDLTVTAVDASSDSVRSAGTYSLYYDLDGNGTGDIRVSSGTASFFLAPAFSGFYTATGELDQILGPANSAFADLAYGDNSNHVLLGGYLDATGGNLSLTLRQNAVVTGSGVPEPASISLLGLGVVALVSRRRRRA